MYAWRKKDYSARYVVQDLQELFRSWTSAQANPTIGLTPNRSVDPEPQPYAGLEVGRDSHAARPCAQVAVSRKHPGDRKASLDH